MMISNKRNPIIKEKNKGIWPIVRVIFLLLYVLYTFAITQIINDLINRNMELGEGISSIVIYGIFSVCIFNSQINPKRIHCIKYINKYIKYSDIISHMETQNFTAIDELNKISESELWLNIDGYFVPKTFIIGTYSVLTSSRFSRNRLLGFVLITGESVCYDCGDVWNKNNKLKVDLLIKKLSKILPNADIRLEMGLMDWRLKNKRILQEKIEEYIEANDIFELIRNYSNFAQYSFDKKSTIDDTDEYLKEYGTLE